jgi:hypothetical protein
VWMEQPQLHHGSHPPPAVASILDHLEVFCHRLHRLYHFDKRTMVTRTGAGAVLEPVRYSNTSAAGDVKVLGPYIFPLCLMSPIQKQEVPTEVSTDCSQCPNFCSHVPIPRPSSCTCSKRPLILDSFLSSSTNLLFIPPHKVFQFDRYTLG